MGTFLKHQALTSERSAGLVRFPLSIVHCHARDGVSGEAVSLLPVSMWSFYHFLWRSNISSFQIFSEADGPLVAVDLVYLWKDVSPGSSCTTTFQKSPQIGILFFFF